MNTSDWALMPGKVLVTGGAGFLGRHVAKALADHGCEVTVLDDLSSPTADFNSPELQTDRVRCVLGTTLDQSLIQQLLRDHYLVVHFAAVVGVEETIVRTIDTIRMLQGTILIREALTPWHTILFGSSADVYGMHSRFYTRGMQESDLHIFEDSHVNRWVYPMVKGLEENIVAGSTARSVNVRIFNCFGPGMDFRKPKRVVPQFIQQLSLGQPLQISGNGKQRRTLCYYEDTVRGILMALQHAQSQTAPYHFTVNIGSTETFSIIDLAHCMMQVALDIGLLSTPLDIRTNAALYSQSFDDTWDRIPDISRARDILGFEPRIPVQEGLRRTLLQCRDLFDGRRNS